MLPWLTENGVELAILVTLALHIARTSHNSGLFKAGLKTNEGIGLSAHKRIDAILMMMINKSGEVEDVVDTGKYHAVD